jgi:hypothetical protein
LRATRAAAAAPNNSTIGGAGTSWPPLDPLEPPLDDDELELLEELELLDELELLEELLLPPKLLEVLVLPPKLLDPPVAPELVEVDEVPPPVDVLLVEAPLLEDEDEPLLEEPWLDDP